jgi:hypothetical protein
MASPTFPRVHAMVMCDEARPRLGEPKAHDLIGVRTEIEASNFPDVHPLL